MSAITQRDFHHVVSWNFSVNKDQQRPQYFMLQSLWKPTSVMLHIHVQFYTNSAVFVVFLYCKHTCNNKN